MTHFSANLNKIALLRNTRDLDLPNVRQFGEIVLAAGADGLTLHPRPDRRHARPEDVHALRALTREHHRELNVEGYPTGEFLDLVLAVRPEQCTLVPDKPDQRTSDHGWDCAAERALLVPVCERLRAAGIRVSLFLDDDPAQVPHAKSAGAERIELYTEPYARAYGSSREARALASFRETALTAAEHGLGVNAGHDLSLRNLGAFLDSVPGVLEVSIGHALTADALELGMAEAVRRYLDLCRGIRNGA